LKVFREEQAGLWFRITADLPAYLHLWDLASTDNRYLFMLFKTVKCSLPVQTE